ncbi:unnamed protein product [Lathyrus sativus]|nr:unnamed protein product [Lathyrus sativus]
MVHPDVFPKQVISSNVQGLIVKEVDVDNNFKNEQEFIGNINLVVNLVIKWIHMEVSKLGFGVVIRRSDNVLDRTCAFVTITCERSRKYRHSLRKFKRDDTGSRKCECSFKLVGHPSVCRLMSEEKERVADMTLNMVQMKKILANGKDPKIYQISRKSIIFDTKLTRRLEGIELKCNNS